MNETKLKTKLVKFLRKNLENSIVFRHEDIFTAGIPDISVTHNGTTLWMEVKHVTPQKPFKSTGLQKHTACQLEKYGKCIFVVFEESKQGILTTKILLPKCVEQIYKIAHPWRPRSGIDTTEYAAWTTTMVQGFDFEFILRFISHPQDGFNKWLQVYKTLKGNKNEHDKIT